MLDVSESIQIPDGELAFTFARSSGPGGQNVNKVNSKAVLHWNAVASPRRPEDVRERFLARYRHRLTAGGDVVISSQRFRDQSRNIADCLEKLRDMLLPVLVPPVRRKKTRPSRGAKERRLEDKRATSQRKQRRRPPPPTD